MAKPCPKCGQLTDDRYVFCGYCGTPLDALAPRPASQQMPQPVPQPVIQQAAPTVPYPVPQTVSQQIPQPAQYPAPQPTSQPMPQPAQYPVPQPTSQPMPQPVYYPAPQFVPPPAPMTGTYPAGVQTTAELSPAPTAPVKKKKPVALIVGVLAFAVILGVAVAVLLIFMNGGGRPQSPQETLDRIIDTALDGDYEKAIDCIYEYRYSDKLRQQALDSMSEMSVFNLKSLGIDKEAVKALVSFKVRGTQEASPRIAESIREKLSDSGVPTDPINKILKSDVMVTLVGNSQSAELYFAETDDGCYLISSEGSMDGIVPQPEDYLK